MCAASECQLVIKTECGNWAGIFQPAFGVIEPHGVAGLALVSGQMANESHAAQRLIVKPDLQLVHDFFLVGDAGTGSTARARSVTSPRGRLIGGGVPTFFCGVGIARFNSLSWRLRPSVSCAARRSMSSARPNTVSTRSMVARLV